MDHVIIHDIRTAKEFSTISFSGFKKTDVKRELITALYNSLVEESCYWSAELVCAGHFADLWDIIIYFFAKYIHIGNPKIAIYLDRRLDTFKTIINDNTSSDIELRNNRSIREIIAEIVVILCESVQSHQHSEIFITKDDFNMTCNTDRFKSPSVEFNKIFLQRDPEEIFVAVNELSYNLFEMDYRNSWYWIEWLMEYDIICRKKKKPCLCETRKSAPVLSKFQKDIGWLIWDVLVNQSNEFSSTIQSIVKSSIHLYALKYVSSQNQFKRRKFLFYFVSELMSSQIVVRDEIIHNKDKITDVLSSINDVYKQIKLNEQAPQLNTKTHTNKSAKLQILNSMTIPK